MRLPGSRDCLPLLEFDAIHRHLRLGTVWDTGRQEIAIDDIIGSVSRAHEFDGCFRPLTPRLRKMLAEIREARPDAADMPIQVYQVDHGYFVEDGHKRVALAVEEGRVYIDAEVRQYGTRFHVARGTTIDDVRATEQELAFREATALDMAVPGQRFPLGEPDEYLELSESVKAHAYDLSAQRREVVPAVEAARHWYDVVFRPAVEIAREAGVARLLDSCSEAELFLLLRRGISDPMGPAWKIPGPAVERSLRNLRAAEPSAVKEVLRAVRPGRPRRRVLDEEAALDEGRGED